ncbi:hypothetical protein [Albidovulum sp.]
MAHALSAGPALTALLLCCPPLLWLLAALRWRRRNARNRRPLAAPRLAALLASACLGANAAVALAVALSLPLPLPAGLAPGTLLLGGAAVAWIAFWGWLVTLFLNRKRRRMVY